MVALHCGQRIHSPSGTPRFGRPIMLGLVSFGFIVSPGNSPSRGSSPLILHRYHTLPRPHRQALFPLPGPARAFFSFFPWTQGRSPIIIINMINIDTNSPGPGAGGAKPLAGAARRLCRSVSRRLSPPRPDSLGQRLSARPAAGRPDQDDRRHGPPGALAAGPGRGGCVAGTAKLRQSEPLGRAQAMAAAQATGAPSARRCRRVRAR